MRMCSVSRSRGNDGERSKDQRSRIQDQLTMQVQLSYRVKRSNVKATRLTYRIPGTWAATRTSDLMGKLISRNNETSNGQLSRSRGLNCGRQPLFRQPLYMPAIVCRLSLWKITRACWLVVCHAKWVPKSFPERLNLTSPFFNLAFFSADGIPFIPNFTVPNASVVLTYQRLVKCRTCIEIISDHTVAFVQQACHQINNNFRGTRQIRHSRNSSFSSVNWKMPEITSNAVAQFKCLYSKPRSFLWYVLFPP